MKNTINQLFIKQIKTFNDYECKFLNNSTSYDQLKSKSDAFTSFLLEKELITTTKKGYRKSKLFDNFLNEYQDDYSKSETSNSKEQDIFSKKAKNGKDIREIIGIRSLIDKDHLWYLMIQINYYAKETHIIESLKTREVRDLFAKLGYVYNNPSNPRDETFRFTFECGLSFENAKELIALTDQLIKDLIQSAYGKNTYNATFTEINDNYSTMSSANNSAINTLIDNVKNKNKEEIKKAFKEMMESLFDKNNDFGNNQFHFISHVAMKIFIGLLKSNNHYYQGSYINQNSQSQLPFEDWIHSIHYDTLIKDMYYILNDTFKCADSNQDKILPLFQKLDKGMNIVDSDIDNLLDYYRLDERSASYMYRYELNLTNELSRSFLILTSFLTGNVDYDSPSNLIKKAHYQFDNNSIYDLWIENATSFIFACEDELKALTNEEEKGEIRKYIFKLAKAMLFITKAISINPISDIEIDEEKIKMWCKILKEEGTLRILPQKSEIIINSGNANRLQSLDYDVVGNQMKVKVEYDNTKYMFNLQQSISNIQKYSSVMDQAKEALKNKNVKMKISMNISNNYEDEYNLAYGFSINPGVIAFDSSPTTITNSRPLLISNKEIILESNGYVKSTLKVLFNEQEIFIKENDHNYYLPYHSNNNNKKQLQKLVDLIENNRFRGMIGESVFRIEMKSTSKFNKKENLRLLKEIKIYIGSSNTVEFKGNKKV